VARRALALLLSSGAVAGCGAPAATIDIPPGAAPTVTSGGAASARVDPAPTALVWETKEERAFAAGRERGLPVLVYLHADWSTPAVQMNRSVWSDPAVLAELREVVPLRIDVTDTEAADWVLQVYGLSSVPEAVLVDASDKSRRESVAVGFAEASRVAASLAAARKRLAR